MSRAFYRLRQFLNLVVPLSPQVSRGQVEKLLTPAQKELFYGMSRFGQRHCLNVCRTLMKSGCRDEDMLRAALLHDVGKAGVGVAHRVACVLLQALAPNLLERWASGEPAAWGSGLYINLHHAELGAALAQAAGASPLTVELIRQHQSKAVRDPRLLAFQQADEIN